MRRAEREKQILGRNCGGHLVYGGRAFAGNSVNAVIFRRDAGTTVCGKDGRRRFFAWYDVRGRIVISVLEESGRLRRVRTPFSGQTGDAHNAISLASDGEGYLHLCWGSHNGALCYARSGAPGGTDFLREAMCGKNEEKVTYPEFYPAKDGGLFFLYRDGRSGDGNLVVNRYDAKEKRWSRLHDALITGGGQRSPYWQAAVDRAGRLHISWVWRESADAGSNHDLSYIVSADARGEAFLTAGGDPVSLPVRCAPPCEEDPFLILKIPEGSALINQTSMACDAQGRPYIASYWREDGAVQYHVLRFADGRWEHLNTGIRKTDFALSGRGTKKLPCARPLILLNGEEILLVFRDEERGERVSLARLRPAEGARFAASFSGRPDARFAVSVADLTDTPVGQWEPVYDRSAWEKEGRLILLLLACGYAKDKTASSGQGQSGPAAYLRRLGRAVSGILRNGQKDGSPLYIGQFSV